MRGKSRTDAEALSALSELKRRKREEIERGYVRRRKRPVCTVLLDGQFFVPDWACQARLNIYHSWIVERRHYGRLMPFRFWRWSYDWNLLEQDVETLRQELHFCVLWLDRTKAQLLERIDQAVSPEEVGAVKWA